MKSIKIYYRHSYHRNKRGCSVCFSGEDEQRNGCKINVQYINESKFLKYMRLACDDGMLFVKAECKAQIKKAYSYTAYAS